jgi:hypothetical protein
LPKRVLRKETQRKEQGKITRKLVQTHTRGRDCNEVIPWEENKKEKKRFLVAFNDQDVLEGPKVILWNKSKKKKERKPCFSSLGSTCGWWDLKAMDSLAFYYTGRDKENTRVEKKKKKKKKKKNGYTWFKMFLTKSLDFVDVCLKRIHLISSTILYARRQIRFLQQSIIKAKRMKDKVGGGLLYPRYD